MDIQLHNENNNNDELFQIMKEKMTTEQEQIFMTSHYLYLQYGADNTKFVIDFDDVWKNVDFAQKASAKRLLVKHFVDNIDYKIGALLKCRASNEKDLGGGQNKETIMLTVECFKNFCMIASTPKSKIIRSYYIKMENIMHEYYKTFMIKNNELQNTLQLSQNALHNSMKETAIKRHEVLIESNRNKWVVYFCRIQLYENGSFILKIGESTDIKNRMEALSCNFGTSVIVLDVFHCENSMRFEKFLHNSHEIVKYKYNQLEHKNKKKSTEAYLIPNQKEYEKIVKFTKIELSRFNDIEMVKIRIQEKTLDCNMKTLDYNMKTLDCNMKKLELISTLTEKCKNYNEIMNIINGIKMSTNNQSVNISQSESHPQIQPQNETIIEEEKEEDENKKSEPKEENNDPDAEDEKEEENNDSDSEEEKEDESTIFPTQQQPVATANATGPIVQIYHKDDLKKVVRVFNSIMEATRDFNYKNSTASFTAIKKAHQNKTLYLDHRWNFIMNRNEPNLQKARDIGDTVVTQERNQGQVAMLNIDKTRILKVFKLSKDAAKEILQHPSAMCSAIKHSTPLNNYYWTRWENVSESLRDAFLELNELPSKPKNVRGIKIKLLHPTTNEIIKIFSSYTDIQKELKISVKKIKECMEKNDSYNGKYRFKLV